MKYPLRPLLSVRVLREDNAAAEVAIAKRRVTEALHAVEKRKQELQDYLVWRVEEENRLFEEIRNRELESEEIDQHRETVRNLRVKDAEYEKRVSDAEQDVVRAREALARAEEAHRLAVKDRQKIDAHRELWQEEENKRIARAEESEMEDFSVRGPGRESEA